ncbi:aminotransferase class IV [Gorillibacterium sp. sgz5001074]|uniref:aminotransferase class IV n=1 Tax=Gorillibacterium sp. sgz5001074 TaxID=3446695 RepID=UPI003F676F6C
MQIAMNGALCASEQAVVSVYDHGFLYGMGLFETYRTYGGAPFLLEEHLLRLADGCRELGIRYEPRPEHIRQLTASLLEANGLEDGYFRLSVSAGTEALGLPAGDYAEPREILYVKTLPPRDAELYETGKALQLLETRRNTPEGDMRLKSFHYMNSILGKRELARYPRAAGAEGLFLDDMGFVAEGLVSNVFFVQDGVLRTPALETNILPGITRDWVLRTAVAAAVLPTEKGFYSWDELLEADEIFVTNSIQELVPVTRLMDPEGHEGTVSDRKAGPVTRRLSELYREATGGGGR